MGPYGLTGDIKLRSFSGETKHLLGLTGSVVVLKKDGKDRSMTVQAAKSYGQYVLIHFNGINNPEDVHVLIGSEVWIDRNNAAKLGANEYYIADLVGCALYFNNSVCAHVISVWSNGATEMFEVETTEGVKVHVPFIAQYIGDVNLPEKRIELLVDWILL